MQTKIATSEIDNSEDSALRTPHSSRRRRTRTGKVARLPFAVRQVVNEMILDGVHYRQIAAKLVELGHPGIRPQNLSEWCKGGYHDWLQRRDELEVIELDRQAAMALAKNPAARCNLNDANELLVSVRLYRTLRDDEPRSLPEFIKVAKAIHRQTRERTRRDEIALAARRRADKVADLAASPSPPRSSPSPPPEERAGERRQFLPPSDAQSDSIRPYPTQ
jgi:hypothetical protein